MRVSGLALGQRRRRRRGPATGHVFEGEYALYFGTNYGVSPDGRTFYMVREIVDPTLNVVVNWFDELRERVPTR